MNRERFPCSSCRRILRSEKGRRLHEKRKHPPKRVRVHAPEVKTEALRCLRAGANLTEVSKGTGIPGPTLARWRQAAGMQGHPGRPPDITLEQLEPVRAMIQHLGLSDGLVAMVCGVPEATVQGWRRRLGLDRSLWPARTGLSNRPIKRGQQWVPDLPVAPVPGTLPEQQGSNTEPTKEEHAS